MFLFNINVTGSVQLYTIVLLLITTEEKSVGYTVFLHLNEGRKECGYTVFLHLNEGRKECGVHCFQYVFLDLKEVHNDLDSCGAKLYNLKS